MINNNYGSLPAFSVAVSNIITQSVTSYTRQALFSLVEVLSYQQDKHFLQMRIFFISLILVFENYRNFKYFWVKLANKGFRHVLRVYDGKFLKALNVSKKKSFPFNYVVHVGTSLFIPYLLLESVT